MVVSVKLVKVYLLSALLGSTLTQLLKEWLPLKSASSALTLSSVMVDLSKETVMLVTSVISAPS
jgi:hypothetical protein